MTELDGEQLIIRPVRATDAARLIEAIDLCSADDVRIRFCGGMSHLSPEFAARLSRTDDDSEMGFVAEDSAGCIVGAARLTRDPQGDTAEYSILVRSDWQKQGLGRRLLRTILDYAQSHGVREVWGDVARDNGPMLKLADSLGFRREAAEDPWRFRLVWTAPPR
jgi:acetyltransferase